MTIFTDLTEAEADAIYASLRLLAVELAAGKVSPNDGDIGDILTNSGKHDGLTAEQVHDLCDALLNGERDPR